MIKVLGKIANVPIDILIDFGSIHSYIAPNIVERCHLKKSELESVSLMQLATCMKRKVIKVVRKCPLDMNGVNNFADLNIIPLVSYVILIGMDWLDAYNSILDCQNGTYLCLDEEVNQVTMRGKPRPIYLTQIIALQLGKCFRKGFQLYASNVEDPKEGKVPELQYYPVLQEFVYVFQELSGMPPKRENQFHY